MGKALSMLSKPIKEFNIESRAHKIISKNKPIPAPMHKSSEIVYEKYKAGKYYFILSIILSF